MGERFVLVALVLAVVSGGLSCAPAARARRPLELTTPPAYGAELVEPRVVAEPRSTDGDRWWAAFGDPHLDALIATALEHNHDLRATAERLRAAAATARIAGADLEPSVAAGTTASRARRNFIGFPIPGGGNVLSTTTTALDLSLSASWEVDLWGRLRAGRRAAVADLAAAGYDLQAARLSIAAQTGKAWYALLEASRQLELARQSAAAFRASADQVRSRYESGTRPALELRLALASLARAEALVELRESLRQRAARRLEVLTGAYPAGRVSQRATLPDRLPPVEAGLPSELLARRPDLRAAEARLAAGDARLAQARRALYPRLSLTAGGGSASDQLRDLVDGDFRIWNLAANLTQPLFQGGRLRAGVDRATAARDEGLERYAAAVLRAFAEVEDSLADGVHLARRAEQMAVAVEQSRAAERLALARYRNGLAPYLTVLEAQERALQSESEWLAVRRQRLDNRVDLHVALGGGFENEVETANRPRPHAVQGRSLR